MGQLAQSMREQPPKSFSCDTKTNPKQCMAVTLRSGKELNEPQNVEKGKDQVQQEILNVETEKKDSEIERRWKLKLREDES